MIEVSKTYVSVKVGNYESCKGFHLQTPKSILFSLKSFLNKACISQVIPIVQIDIVRKINKYLEFCSVQYF